MINRNLLAAWMLLSMACVESAGAQPSITVGHWELEPDNAQQEIEIWVAGGQPVEGLNFVIQVGDGGQPLGGSDEGPSIQDLDIFTGTIFANNNTGTVDLDGPNATYPEDQVPMWEGRSTTVIESEGPVLAEGLLGVVTMDTTGCPSGTWPLRMGLGVMDGPTDFAGVAADIIEGSITIPPVHVLEVSLQGGAGGNWANQTSTLVLAYGEIGATSARDDPDGLDVDTGWGADKFSATSEGDFGIYTRNVPFGPGEDMLVRDARPLDDTANVLIEAYTNKVYPWPDTWIPGETWNEGGMLEFSVTSNDKDFFDDFRIVQKLPGRFLDDEGLADTLLGDVLDASGQGSLPFDRIGCPWWPDLEADWWIGPFASFDLVPAGGTEWAGPADAPLVVEAGAHAILHTCTPEPSSFVLLVIAAAGLGAYAVRSRSRRSKSDQSPCRD